MLEYLPTALSAVLMPTVLAVHMGYFRLGSRRSTKQHITVRDESVDTPMILSIEGPSAARPRTAEQIITLHVETIARDDLHLAGRHRHKNPLKVTGDLVIDGFVTFDGPVTVDGHVTVNGEAEFQAGLLAKGEIHVSGRARFGTDAKGSWCIARRMVGKVVTAPIQENLQQDVLTA